jgi:hypothetical protein
MLDMCLVTHVFLQVNLCLISKMKGMRYEHVKEEKKKSIVRNIGKGNSKKKLIFSNVSVLI